MPEALETVKLTFDGGIATRGRIHLYEYSRSQYALARFVNTVERFRRVGEVQDKVTRASSIDMIVEAPERGTFDLSILVPIAHEAANQLQGVSFKALFSYVWGKLLPPSEAKSQIAVELAKLELERERERTKQIVSGQDAETERLRIFRDVVARQDATTEQYIALLGSIINNPDVRLSRTGSNLQQLAKEEEFARADLIREREIAEQEKVLSHIDPEKINRLTNKLRPMVGDIALPLRRSADRCYVGDAKNDNSYIRMDTDRAKLVTSRRIDDAEIVFSGLLRSYDRYTYRGKIESDDFPKTMYFTVELDQRDQLRGKIIEAMRKRQVEFKCATYRDPANNITSLILRDIEE